MNLAYLVMGTRRGHAARAVAVGEELRSRGHQLRFYTDRDALKLLRQEFAENQVVEITMPTYIERNGRISTSRTLMRNLPYLVNRASKSKVLMQDLNAFKPDALLSDFEPLGYYAAPRLQCPLIAINSQGFIRHSHYPKLPLPLQLRLNSVHLLKKALTPRSDLEISSKAFVTGKKGTPVQIVGPCIRKSIREANWTPGGKGLTVYLPQSLSHTLPRIVDFSERHAYRLHIYGPDQVPEAARPYLRKPDLTTFTTDLLHSDRVITSAGSQLLGEIAYLGIPTWIIPEPRQPEQSANTRLACAWSPQFQRWPTPHPPDLSRSTQTVQDGTLQIATAVETFLEIINPDGYSPKPQPMQLTSPILRCGRRAEKLFKLSNSNGTF